MRRTIGWWQGVRQADVYLNHLHPQGPATVRHPARSRQQKEFASLQAGQQAEALETYGINNVHRQLCEACLEKEYETYRHARVHEAMQQNDLWKERFQIDAWPRWDYDLDSNTLVFSQDGRPKVSARIVAAGSVHNDQWEWTWGNRTFPDPTRMITEVVRSFGERKQWPALTTLFLPYDAYLGWELTAIAAHLCEAEATYRCPGSVANDYLYLMLFETKYIDEQSTLERQGIECA